MSAETDYLKSYFQSPYQLGVTLTSAQRSRARPGPSRAWEPGLASFGWGNLGHQLRDATGQIIAISFSCHVWFSDRVVRRQGDPTGWQQFSGNDSDPVNFTFSITGDHVHLKADLQRWNATWEAESTAYSAPTEELLFVIPGAGAGAPPAILITSFGPGAPLL
jgi:hypothetical protein